MSHILIKHLQIILNNELEQIHSIYSSHKYYYLEVSCLLSSAISSLNTDTKTLVKA